MQFILSNKHDKSLQDPAQICNVQRHGTPVNYFYLIVEIKYQNLVISVKTIFTSLESRIWLVQFFGCLLQIIILGQWEVHQY